MKINFTLNFKKNKTIGMLILTCLLLLSSTLSFGQCGFDPTCSNTDYLNFGMGSTTNATTLEYDNFCSSFHSTAVRTSNGVYKVWGEDSANDGTSNLLSPTIVNVTNFPALTGNVLKIGLGSNYVDNSQRILLSTSGLFAWGTRGIVLHNSITPTTTFQKLTIDGQANGLPVGVNPSDVKMMFVTYQTIAITTCSGDVWVISQLGENTGTGLAGVLTAVQAAKWYKVTQSTAGNPSLDNVIAVRGQNKTLFALKSDGTLWTWGAETFLADTTVESARNRATQMTLPTANPIKMIGTTRNQGSNPASSYYVLNADGNLYTLGANAQKQLGDWTTTTRLVWVQPKYSSAAGPVMNDIHWISPNEHDTYYGAVNVLTSNSKIYNWGNNNNSMLGRAVGTNDPGVPAGINNLTDDIIAVETGGHTTMVAKKCEDYFGYVGHRISGSMANGSALGGTEVAFVYTTAIVYICGASTIDVTLSGSPSIGLGGLYCNGTSVILTPTPAGGTLSVLSGPGTLVGNVLTFNGSGNTTVQMQYSYNVPGCPIAKTVTLNLLTEDCNIDVGIVKTVDNPTPNVGSTVTFTLTANNAGPTNSTGVVVNDVLPAGYTFVSATPSTGTWTAPNWSIGNLANGASATMTIVATVNATGPYANTATITLNETDPTPGNNTSTSTPVPVAQANVGIVKTVSNPTPNVGSTVTFTLTANNAGPSAATGVVVNDVLPAGYTFVSATPSTGTWTAPNWSIGNLANGASATMTIVATVNATGPYANTATITLNETDPTPGNNTSTSTPVPVAQANVGIVKTVSNPTPNVGSTVTFTLTANNAGPSAATGVVVNDVLPAGYTFVSATPSTGTWTAPNWSIGNLANGASATMTIVATVNATGPYANTATITLNETDPTPGNNTSTSTPVPVAQANVGIVKTVSNPTPNVGSTVTFTLTANNAGPSAATGVVVNDVLPAGYTFVSATPSTGTWTAPNWNIGNLANGASATMTIVATVNATGPYANTATITLNETDPTPANNTSTSTPVPVAQANVGIVKTVSNPTPNVGSTVTFTLTANNAGPSAATGVVVNDVLPAGYTFVSATPSTGTWTAPNWNIGNLANGASATMTIVATVNATGPYANTATITLNETDPTPGNNTSTSTPVPVAQANVGIVKTVSNPTPNVGSTVTFTLTANNAGPSAATGVVVNDVLPAGYTFVSATPSTGTWTAPNWNIGNLANGASATMTIVATVNATGPYANTATITLNETDPTPGNNTSTSTPVPVAQANVGIVKTVSNPTPNVGSTVTFTLTANNAGPSAATGVVVNDVLPAGYTFVSATPSTGTWTAPNWNIGNLANGASATMTIVATVNATGPYANTATITLNETDPTPGNNTSTSTPVPVAQANVGIVKTVSNPTPNVGSTVTFTLTANNAGPSAATGVVVNDVLPAGYTFVSATPSTGTWTAPNWNIGNLANGASATMTIVATVNATGPYANTATITLNETDPTPGNNTSTSTPVPVNVIIANNDTPVTATATVPSSIFGVTIVGNVTMNDTLNGVVVTATNTNVTPNAVGVLSINATGDVSLQPNTPSGTYTIPYTICEANTVTGLNLVPANCDSAIATVVVLNPIVAVADIYPSQSSGVTSTIVGNVTTNDTLNGVIVTASNSDVTPVIAGPLSIDANGVLTLAANTPSGSYPITYTICEINPTTGLAVAPPNCSSITNTIVVFNPIVADDEAPVTVATTGATVPVSAGNVTVGDTLNGVQVTSSNTNVTPIIATVASPIGLDANGNMTVLPNTPSGTYVVTYTICEADPVTGLSIVPANCDIAQASVVVLNPIDAIVDVFTSQTGIGGTVGNVTTNDTLNGVLVTASNTDVTPVIAGPLSIDANGVLTLAANTPSGSYPITYTICEVNPVTGLAVVPANCDTVTDIIVVANVIDAINDATITVETGSGPGLTVVPANVTANDTLFGLPVTSANTNVVPSTTGPLSIDADGVLMLAPDTPSGTYSIIYTICEANPVTGATLVPANCDSAMITVIVANIIDAIIDVPVTVQTGFGPTPTVVLPVNATGNVTLNDLLHGSPVTTTNTNVIPVTAGPLHIDSEGVITLDPNTPSGTYVITYQICEANPATGLTLTPQNCDTTTATVVVANVINAVIDGPVTVQSGVGTTVITPVNGTGNVTTNDTLNGIPVTTANTNVTPITTGPLSVNSNGVITLAGNTPSGTYVITYTICEADPVTGLDVIPSNCSTVTVTVIVANVIDAVDDPAVTVATSGSTTPVAVGNVTVNDTLNGVQVTSSNTNVTPIIATVASPIGLDANGNMTVLPNTPSGTYQITYQICEADPITGLNLVPANCDTAIATVVVLNPIVADDDQATTISGSTGATGVINIFDNDTLNGNPTGLSEVTLSVITPDPSGHIVLNADGTVDVLPNTPAGTYTITYEICEIGAVPANCDTATVTVTVNPIDDLDVYNHLTPNDDGDNEFFFIDGIDRYPNNTVEIYNRWGVLVYEVSGYNNKDKAFKGISDGRVTVNRLENLPEGTYYYILRYNKPTGESKEKSGYLYINR